MKQLSIETSLREKFLDITHLVNGAVRESGVEEGRCFVFCPHATAGLTINECADPAVALDMKSAFRQLVPGVGHWLHKEGNSPAHVKASLVGASVTVPVVEGALRMGTWQGVFLCEFDGPRTREVWVEITS